MADTRVRRRVVTGVGAAVIIGLAVGGYAYATAPDGPDLRLADATYADVSQTLTSAGTVVPVDQAAVNFPVAGRVAAVSVSVGQQVVAGQPLAVLDTTGLTAQVSAAQATIAADQAKLTADENHQTSTATGSGDGGGSSNASGSGSTGGSGGGSNARASGGDGGSGGGSNGAGGSGGGGNASASTNAAVTAAQHKLVSDQQKADGALRAASAALTHANQLCGPTTGSPGTTPTGSGTASNSTAGNSTPAPAGGATGTRDGGSATGGSPAGSGPTAGGLASGSPSGGGSTSGSPASGSGSTGSGSAAGGSGGGAGGHSADSGPAAGTPTAGGQTDPAECRAALDTALTNQNAVGTAQSTVETDINALTTILNSATTQTVHSSPSATTSATSGRAASAGRTSSTEATTTVTPEQLVADQSTIDAAQAAVDEAEQNLAQAQLVSPVNGTVGQVSLTAGEQVGTSPATPEVTVIGTGGDQVTTTIDAAVVGEAKVGDRVQVTPDGGTRAVTGRILTIGLLPATTTSTGYPVTIELDDPGAPLADGAGADVAISVDEVTHVLTVPTSAVTLTRGGAMVHVLRDGARTTARVAVGAVGAERTQITSGLQAGDQVILADLAQPLPTATTNTGRGVRNLI
jgi:multidrug efflux pump subunit AcrA (membrane-fusion protein)